ncbi:MAG: hypothetical protein QF561_04735 [Phycisphaerales bacterium]|jgi:hypothetical protein|nr:hypothetical protein [Phycisphaerales bacterium]
MERFHARTSPYPIPVCRGSDGHDRRVLLCPTDLDVTGDGVTDIEDVLAVIGDFGTCP